MSRKWAVAGLATALVAVLFVLNVTGVVLIPWGPLGDHQPPVPDVAMTILDHQPGRGPLYLTPLVDNAGPLTATIVRVTPVGVTVPDSVQVLGSLPFDRNDPAQDGADTAHQVILGIEEDDPGAGWASPEAVAGGIVAPSVPGERRGRAFLVRLTPLDTEETAVLRFDVEYAIGPLRFITTAWGPAGTTLVVCGRDRPVSGDGCGPP